MAEIAILGADGYTGWPLTCRLLDRGYDVVGVDNFARHDRADSITPIPAHPDRLDAAAAHFGGRLHWQTADVTDYRTVRRLLSDYDPHTVVNLAQIPSAPFSMQSRETAWETQRNNVEGSLNLMWALAETGRTDTHVVQLATMGEYGTPDTPIPEGFLDDGRPAPKDPGSFYHASKVNTTTNTLFAARTWDIPVTEIYQGIVFGVSMFEGVDPALVTRFDADPVWGTVLNRFVAQAVVGHPLTVYGDGGQKRAALSLPDCIQCLDLAIHNPPERGTERYPYRAINQFQGAWRVQELADLVSSKTGADVVHLDNPRVEDDSEHYYEPEREVLDELGYEPRRPLPAEVERTLEVIERHADRIPEDQLRPTTTWEP